MSLTRDIITYSKTEILFYNIYLRNIALFEGKNIIKRNIVSISFFFFFLHFELCQSHLCEI